MANNLTSNPWVIDTAGAATLYVTDIFVEHFVFTGYSTAGNQVVVQDRFGKTVWVGIGDSLLEDIQSTKIVYMHGIAVPTLQGGGILRVYIR